jgi:hypothetical protein
MEGENLFTEAIAPWRGPPSPPTTALTYPIPLPLAGGEIGTGTHGPPKCHSYRSPSRGHNRNSRRSVSYQPHAPARIDPAPVPPAIVRRAIDRLSPGYPGPGPAFPPRPVTNSARQPLSTRYHRDRSPTSAPDHTQNRSVAAPAEHHLAYRRGTSYVCRHPTRSRSSDLPDKDPPPPPPPPRETSNSARQPRSTQMPLRS